MSKSDQPRRALGKGMGALLPTRTHTLPPPAPVTPATGEPHESSLNIPVDAIQPNPLQPRRVFQDNRLEELAQSTWNFQRFKELEPKLTKKLGEPAGGAIVPSKSEGNKPP